MEEIVCLDNFFSEDDLSVLEQAISEREPGRDQVNEFGPFAGKLIANNISIIDNQIANNLIVKKLSTILEKPFTVDSLFRIKLYCPWDVHSDFYPGQCQSGYVPYYCFLIPLDDVPSRTIIFNEISDHSNNYSNNFSEYKKTHDKSPNPVDEQFWEENLSMCWPIDREYVSLKKIMPYQRRGQLHGWPCEYFHSSDNFHTRISGPKEFIIVRTGVFN